MRASACFSSGVRHVLLHRAGQEIEGLARRSQILKEFRVFAQEISAVVGDPAVGFRFQLGGIHEVLRIDGDHAVLFGDDRPQGVDGQAADQKSDGGHNQVAEHNLLPKSQRLAHG